MIEPIMNVAASILVQAERDYHYERMLRWEVSQFLKGGWFQTICEALEFDIGKTQEAIRGGYGLCDEDGRVTRKLYGDKGRVLNHA